MLAGRFNIWTQRLIGREQVPYEVLALLADFGRFGEVALLRVEYCVVAEHFVLRLSVAEGSLSEEHLVEDDPDAPAVDLVAYPHALVEYEALGRQVPVPVD